MTGDIILSTANGKGRKTDGLKFKSLMHLFSGLAVSGFRFQLISPGFRFRFLSKPVFGFSLSTLERRGSL